ncbi:MAG: glycosyltransferase [Zoogloeaceae bacterium]|nr:glycosyltransferase [Zoogloeaceae bacterium]
MVTRILAQLNACPEVGRVFLTLNRPEVTCFPETGTLTLIHNSHQKGFGDNHNAAFRKNTLPFFCVLNPDVTLIDNPFPALLEALKTPEIGVAAPQIFSPQGKVEDNARHFPTFTRLLRQVLRRNTAQVSEGDAPWFPDWVAGMFMLFRSEIYANMKGFDPDYYLYYEDVDLCLRLRRLGWKSALVPTARAIHDARRASHYNLRHFTWHLASMIRYLWHNAGILSAPAFSPSHPGR